MSMTKKEEGNKPVLTLDINPFEKLNQEHQDLHVHNEMQLEHAQKLSDL